MEVFNQLQNRDMTQSRTDDPLTKLKHRVVSKSMILEVIPFMTEPDQCVLETYTYLLLMLCAVGRGMTGSRDMLIQT
jgi:hypothetical protein